MIGQKIFKLIEDLFPITRSITGDGVRETLLKIKKGYLPNLKIYEIPSGTVVEDWVIPKEWNIKEAYIKDSNGEKIIDLNQNNLHILSYSLPINREVQFDELDTHLFSLPDNPKAIPYVTSYYSDNWGFCISHKQREAMTEIASKTPENKFHVLIDSSLEDGSLTYADLIIPGEIEDEIFFSTYICHPSMANNELSGPGLATFLAKYISEKSNYYTYRFSFTPETIGAIAYISENKNELRKVVAAFNLTCVGDNQSFSFMPSRNNNSITDKVARHVIKHQKEDYIEFSFMNDRGSDERQYCSPGIDLPMVSIMKSKYGEYPEYHTSLDNLDFISSEGLESSYQVHLDCLNILENNFKYVSTFAGEPFLSKRGKNYTIIGGKENNESKAAKLILDIIACCDGSMDIVDIAERIEIYAIAIIPIISSLEADGIIKKID